MCWTGAMRTSGNFPSRSVAENPGTERGSRAWDQETNSQTSGEPDRHCKQGADMYGDDRLGVVAILHEAGSHRHKCEIGDGGGHEELEECLRPTEVACLTRAELHQPRQPVLGGLTQLAIRRERLALLEGPRLLEQGLLWMDHHQTTFAGLRPHARGSQRACVADGGVEAERPQGDARRTVTIARTDRHHLLRLLAGGAYAAHGPEIDQEVLFGELGTSASCGHFRHELPSGLGEGVRFRLFDQFQRPLV